MIDRIIQDQEIKAAKELIDASSDIVVIAHTSPDGDAIGSVLGMWHWLKIMGKNARMVMPDELPSGFEWMPDVEKILIHRLQNEEGDKLISEADLIICLDLNEPKRLGSAQQAFLNSKAKRLLVDHHLYPADSWDVCVSYPDMSSACEVLYRLIYQMDAEDKIDAVTASCIYTGLMTDTGNFRFENTSANTFRAAADLVEAGANPNYIYKKCYETKTKNFVMFQNYCVNKAVFLEDNKIAYTTVYKKDLEKFSAGDDFTDGIAETLRAIDTTEVSFVVKEVDTKLTKVSMRSKNADVAKVCMAFGGGGHTFAAGCTIKANIKESIAQLLKEIKL